RIKYLAHILEIDQALQAEAYAVHHPVWKLKSLKSFLEQFYVSRDTAPEASNLVNPGTHKVFTAAEIQVLKSQGVDLSLFDPPHDNGVIELRDIATNSVDSRYNKGQNALHQGLHFELPAGNVVYYDEI